MKLSDLKPLNTNVWYHGSKNRFDSFELQIKNIVDGARRNALFFSKSKTFAAYHGHYIYTVILTPKKTFDAKDMFVSLMPGQMGGWDEEKNLTPLGKKFYEAFNRANTNDDYDAFESLSYMSLEHWDIMESNLVQNLLQQLGYDSFFVTGDGERNIGILDPTTIKIINIEEK